MSRVNVARLAGEFGVIVLGVLTALTLESGWQHWRDVRDEDLYVEALREEVIENIAVIDERVEVILSARANLIGAAQRLTSTEWDGSTGAIEFPLFFAAVTGLHPSVSQVVLSELTSTGSVGLIRDDELRREVQRGYASIDANLARLETNTSRYGGGLLNLMAGYGLGPTTEERPWDLEVALGNLAKDPSFDEEVRRAVVRLDSALGYLRFAHADMQKILDRLNRAVDR